jgi:hypothetical protein
MASFSKRWGIRVFAGSITRFAVGYAVLFSPLVPRAVARTIVFTFIASECLRSWSWWRRIFNIRGRFRDLDWIVRAVRARGFRGFRLIALAPEVKHRDDDNNAYPDERSVWRATHSTPLYRKVEECTSGQRNQQVKTLARLPEH